MFHDKEVVHVKGSGVVWMNMFPQIHSVEMHGDRLVSNVHSASA